MSRPLSDDDAVAEFGFFGQHAALRELRPYLDEARRGVPESQCAVGEIIADCAEAAAVVVQLPQHPKLQARAKRLLMVLGAALFELLDADAEEF